MSDNDNVKVRYARGTGRNLGKADNKANTWGGLKTILRKVRRTAETMAEYDKLSADEQAELKRAPGFWFASATTLGVRKRGQLLPRRIWSLDLDELTPETLAEIRAGVHPICRYEMIAHPTRGDREHKGKPRLRGAILLKQEVTEEQYEGLSRIAAWTLFGEEGFNQVDQVTHRPGQLMYLASVSHDQPWEVIEFEGEQFDIIANAEQWGIDTHGDKDAWLNPQLWPRKAGEGEYRATQAKAQNPLEKSGIVGAFCRAYSVYEAIDEFIPDVYSPVDQSWGGKDRYTYNYGHASAGVEIQDDGLFIYSHHGSDPAGDRLCNAFDMVRIHRFGDQDGELPDEGAADGPKITARPSYKAMTAWARSLDPVLKEYGGVDADSDFDDEDVAGEDEPEPEAQITSDAPLPKSTTYDADIEEFIGPPKEEKPKPTLIEKMNSRHAVALVGGDTVVINTSRDEISYSSFTDLRNYYANKKMPKANGQEYTRAEWWFEHPERLNYPNGVVFAPGKKPKGAYNLFRGWKVEPRKGSCQLILDHILKVICGNSAEDYKWLMGYFAHMVQKPAEKPGVAVVFKGLKGTGKDSVVEYLAAFLGRYRVKIAQMEQLTGKFNSQLQHALLVHVEEAIWAGDPKAQGPLKNLITSESIRIEPKGVDSFEVASVLRIIMTTNEKWAVPATGDERRFAVFEVSPRLAELAARDRTGELEARAYFDALHRERDNGGAAALLALLLAWDISDMNVRRPPNTAGLTGQKLQSLKGTQRWWFHKLTVGTLPAPSDPTNLDPVQQDWMASELVTDLDTLYADYLDHQRGQRFGVPATLHEFQEDLVEFVPAIRVPSSVRRNRLKALGIPVDDNVTQRRMRIIPAVNHCRAIFERLIGGTIAWGDDTPVEDTFDLI